MFKPMLFPGIAGLFCALLVSPALAATFNVNSTATTFDSNPGDGICDDGAGRCTLRAAINEANALPGADIINLVPGATYTFSDIVSPDIAGLPRITSQVTINGNGATIRRSAAAGTPLFEVLIAFQADLTLKDVTITGGATDDSGFGGGFQNNQSTTTMIRSTVTGNQAGNGGGILNYYGTLILINSTVSGNHTTLGGYGGGGILNIGAVGTTLISSTIAENWADGPPGFTGRGDAIAAVGGPFTVKNSILASPVHGLGDDCYAVVLISAGHNVASDNSCPLSGAGDLNGMNPLLGPLASNGGPTMTMALLSSSPAIDAVPTAACTDLSAAPVTTDQRGVPRPQGTACDIGAFELVATPQGQIAVIVAKIQALVGAGTLTADQGAGLIDKLNQIIAKLNNGQTGPGCIQLDAFIHQVESFVKSGALTATQGQELIAAAGAVKAQIGCRN